MVWNLDFISEEDFKKHVRATIMKYLSNILQVELIQIFFLYFLHMVPLVLLDNPTKHLAKQAYNHVL